MWMGSRGDSALLLLAYGFSGADACLVFPSTSVMVIGALVCCCGLCVYEWFVVRRASVCHSMSCSAKSHGRGSRLPLFVVVAFERFVSIPVMRQTGSKTRSFSELPSRSFLRLVGVGRTVT